MLSFTFTHQSLEHASKEPSSALMSLNADASRWPLDEKLLLNIFKPPVPQCLICRESLCRIEFS